MWCDIIPDCVSGYGMIWFLMVFQNVLWYGSWLYFSMRGDMILACIFRMICNTTPDCIPEYLVILFLAVFQGDRWDYSWLGSRIGCVIILGWIPGGDMVLLLIRLINWLWNWDLLWLHESIGNVMCFGKL